MRSTEAASAFAEYMATDRLETEPINSSQRPSGNLTHRLTTGIQTIIGNDTTKPPPAANISKTNTPPISLPDGRLNIGTHLPLLDGRYRYLGVLGEGASAQAVLAEDTLHKSGGLVSIKVFRRQYSYAGQREARALRFLHSRAPNGHQAPGIVKVLATFSISGHFCLVTEQLYPRFLEWIVESSTMPHERSLHSIRKIGHQLLMSILFMHNHGVVHADLKPDNILFTQPQGSASVGIRLIDFGGAVSITETNTQDVVFEAQTLPYRSPEAALGLGTGPAMDIFSIGVILAEAALKRPLFPCQSVIELLQQMIRLLGPIPMHMLDTCVLAQRTDMTSLRKLNDEAAANANNASNNSNLTRLATDLCIEAGKQADITTTIDTKREKSALIKELQQLDLHFADLIEHLLQYDPENRLRADQALLHPFFDDLNGLRRLIPSLGDIEEKATFEKSNPAQIQAPAEEKHAAREESGINELEAPKSKTQKTNTAPNIIAKPAPEYASARPSSFAEVGHVAEPSAEVSVIRSKKARRKEQTPCSEDDEDDDEMNKRTKKRGSANAKKPWWMV